MPPSRPPRNFHLLQRMMKKKGEEDALKQRALHADMLEARRLREEFALLKNRRLTLDGLEKRMFTASEQYRPRFDDLEKRMFTAPKQYRRRVDDLEKRIDAAVLKAFARFYFLRLRKIEEGCLDPDSTKPAGFDKLRQVYKSQPSVVHLHEGDCFDLKEEMKKFFNYSPQHECFFLSDYHRKDSERGSTCGFSKLILELKRNSENAIKEFAEFFAPIRAEELFVVAVPSSDPKNRRTGIRYLAKKISALLKGIVKSGLLIRTRKIPKKSAGGERDLQADLESLELLDAEKFDGKNVLLLDDVVTSGTTISACEEIIREAGPRSIVRVALAKTYSTKNDYDTISPPTLYSNPHEDLHPDDNDIFALDDEFPF
jgi:hypothetical protein